MPIINLLKYIAIPPTNVTLKNNLQQVNTISNSSLINWDVSTESNTGTISINEESYPYYQYNISLFNQNSDFLELKPILSNESNTINNVYNLLLEDSNIETFNMNNKVLNIFINTSSINKNNIIILTATQPLIIAGTDSQSLSTIAILNQQYYCIKLTNTNPTISLRYLQDFGWLVNGNCTYPLNNKGVE